jgi:hypothetical protein
MKSYRDFDLEITDPVRDEAGVESLLVRVAASPAGEQRRAEAARVTIGADLRKECGRLDRRELDLGRLIELGRALGGILLPEAARGFFARSRAALAEGEGLRLRLKLDTWGFADLPWEYAWLPPGGDAAAPADASGFLALDPRLSIVRYELLSEPIADLGPTGAKSLRVVAVLAAPKDERWVPLDLEGEERGLRKALATRREIRLDVVEDATLANLERALLDGAQAFHFAGHGRFQAAIDDKVETVAGKGFLVFCDAEGRGAEVPAETVVVNLRGRGVRLAVLGACEGARRDRINPWTGIAPALVRGGLPAAVAMQATLYDRSAVAFSNRFYEALALGLPVDAAVTAGRLAIFNESGPGERDWGVPVLYLRAETGVLFPRKEGEEALAAAPLGARGWINVVLSAAAIGLLLASFYLLAHPRLSDRWLVGSGLTFASIVGGVLVWIQWLAGDDARAWARQALRHRFATAALGAGLLAVAGLAGFLVTHRPTVLHIVPGTNLANEIFEGGPVFSLRVWQGDSPGAEPDWTIERLPVAGVAIGSSKRVAEVALGRSAEPRVRAEDDYLTERRVPPTQHATWRGQWNAEPPAMASGGAARRRGRTAVRVELLCNGEPQALESSSFPAPRQVTDALEESVELLFIEPVELSQSCT